MPRHGFSRWSVMPIAAVSLLERSMQGREALVLYCGLGLSTSLVVGSLGLRWPVLLPGLLPPLASLGVWQWARPRLRSPAPTPPPTCLFDAGVLQERLQLDAALAHEPARYWHQIGQQLEAMRGLAAACAELDPGCATPLLVMLERLVQRALAMGDDFSRLSTAPTPGSLLLHSRRFVALQDHLWTCHEALTGCYDAALEEAMECPDGPATVVLSTLLLES